MWESHFSWYVWPKKWIERKKKALYHFQSQLGEISFSLSSFHFMCLLCMLCLFNFFKRNKIKKERKIERNILTVDSNTVSFFFTYSHICLAKIHTISFMCLYYFLSLSANRSRSIYRCALMQFPISALYFVMKCSCCGKINEICLLR